MYNFFMNNSMKIQIKSITFSKAGLLARNKRTKRKIIKLKFICGKVEYRHRQEHIAIGRDCTSTYSPIR